LLYQLSYAGMPRANFAIPGVFRFRGRVFLKDAVLRLECGRGVAATLGRPARSAMKTPPLAPALRLGLVHQRRVGIAQLVSGVRILQTAEGWFRGERALGWECRADLPNPAEPEPNGLGTLGNVKSARNLKRPQTLMNKRPARYLENILAERARILLLGY
jgi:hypothetical protein